MNKHKLSIPGIVFLGTILVLPWGICRGGEDVPSGNGSADQPRGKQYALKDAEKAAAALRGVNGMMKNVTNDERLSTAREIAERRAKAAVKGGTQ